MALLRRGAPRKEEYFLGGDLSLTGSGIIVLDSQYQVVFSKTLKSKYKGMERLQFILDEVEKVIRAYPPKEVCIEGYAMSSRSGQSFSIGELGGVIKLFLYNEGITPYVVPPTRLKKFITGGGACEKSMIVLKVFQRWGWEAADDDQADGYGLARLAKELFDATNKGFINTDGLNKAQQEVVRDVLNPPPPKRKKK